MCWLPHRPDFVHAARPSVEIGCKRERRVDDASRCTGHAHRGSSPPDATLRRHLTFPSLTDSAEKRCIKYCSVSNAWSLEHARALLPAHVCPHESSLLVLLARLGASTMVRLQPLRHCMSAVVAPHSIASHPAPCVRVRSEPPPRPIRLRVCKCLTP